MYFMKNKFLIGVVFASVLIGFFVLIYFLNSYYVTSHLRTNPTETLSNYFQFMERINRKAMEDYVTATPEIYRRQLYENARKADVRTIISDQRNNLMMSNSGKMSNNSESRPSESEYSILLDLRSKARLVDDISPNYMFLQKRFLKEIVQIWQKDNQARVSVILGSRIPEGGWGDIPTSFYLYKESNGKWRIFLMQTMVVNKNYAQ